MARKFSRDTCRTVTVRVEVIDGTDVVQSTTGNIVTTGGIRACHDPGRAKRDSVDLIRCVGIPDNQLSIL